MKTMDEDYESIIENSEVEDPNALEQPILPAEDETTPNKNDNVSKSKKIRKVDALKLTKLPKARIKAIMKMDPDTNIISNDAVFLVSKATEMFLQTLAKEAFVNTARVKRKTVTKADLKAVFETHDSLCFLEGALKN